jgi:hypothetical protein
MQDDTKNGNNGGKTTEPQPLFTDEEIEGFETAKEEAELREQLRRQVILRERADRYTYLMETLTTEYGELTAPDAQGLKDPELGMIYQIEKLMGYVARRRHETYLESSVEELVKASRQDLHTLEFGFGLQYPPNRKPVEPMPVPEGTIERMLEDASNAGYLPVTDEQVAATVDNIKAHLLTQLQGKTPEDLRDALKRGEDEGRALTEQTKHPVTVPKEYARTHCANCQARLLDEHDYCRQCGMLRDGSGYVGSVLEEMGGGYKAQEVPTSTTARVTEDLTPVEADETYDYSHIADPSA